MSLSIVWRQGFLLFARQWLQESPTRSQLTEREIQISSEAISITNTTFVGEGVVMIVAAWTHLRRVGWGSLWQEEGGQWASEKMRVIREIKFDVAWSYVKRQTAKMTSEFVFFSSNPWLNHIKIEKFLLLIATNTNIFTLLFNELTTDGKSFIFAVCRLTCDHVTSNLISLKMFGNREKTSDGLTIPLICYYTKLSLC